VAERRRPLNVTSNTGARYVSVRAGASTRFSVAHHFDGARFEVTVRDFSAPAEVRARAVLAEGEMTMTGDSSAWTDVPRLYVEYVRFAPWKDFVLIALVPAANRIDVQRLAWYDDSYDKGYQGIVGVLALPGGECALVSVQRSSRLVLHDLATGAKRQSIDLGNRGGNPELELRASGQEVWATDYDTLVVVRTSDWFVVRHKRLQSAFTGTQAFVGELSFAPDAPPCLVARPFSGEVVAIDIGTLRTKAIAKLGQQPLQVAALRGGEVVARDWKTGALLRGRLKRRWLF
jgi:hypothetical protein